MNHSKPQPHSQRKPLPPNHIHQPQESRFVYIEQIPETIPNPKPHTPNQPYHLNHTTPTNPTNNFSLSIARPKLDFPTFSGEEPFNWLRQCERYFSLASVPIDS
jgi:hypothetical protein